MLTKKAKEQRDKYLGRLEANNEKLRAPAVRFWQVVDERLRDADSPITSLFCPEWIKAIAENTDYLLARGDEVYTKPIDFRVSPYPVPKDIGRSGNHGLSREQIAHMPLISFLKEEHSEALENLVKENVDILAALCRIDLESRLKVSNFQGVYAYAGLDIDLPYQLGGRWLIIEPSYTNPDYEIRVKEETRFGRKGLRDRIIKLTHSPILKRKRLAKDVSSFEPDVVLLKFPHPAADYEDLLEFYSRFLKKRTLVVADENISHPQYRKQRNLLGIKGLSVLESEQPIYLANMLRYPLASFRVYSFNPKKK